MVHDFTSSAAGALLWKHSDRSLLTFITGTSLGFPYVFIGISWKDKASLEKFVLLPRCCLPLGMHRRLTTVIKCLRVHALRSVQSIRNNNGLRNDEMRVRLGGVSLWHFFPFFLSSEPHQYCVWVDGFGREAPPVCTLGILSSITVKDLSHTSVQPCILGVSCLDRWSLL